MSVFGTQMHIVTFFLVNLEIIFLFYLWVSRLSRPDDRSTTLNIFLLLSLIFYNTIGGLLPDPQLPGSFFLQSIAVYATALIIPCYFPYYALRFLELTKPKFHARRGVYYFLITPYLCFILIFWMSGDSRNAQNILLVPVIYGVIIAASLFRAIGFNYQNNFTSREARQMIVVLLVCLTLWIAIPILEYLDPGQATKVLATNAGFLLLIGLQVHKNIEQQKSERSRLLEFERRLRSRDADLRNEVYKRTRELEHISEQQMKNFMSLVHETKTPLTLVNNYLDEYISKNGLTQELDILKKSLDKMTADVINLFDMERLAKGIDIYEHNSVSNFSAILKDGIPLFQHYCDKHNIKFSAAMEDSLMVHAAPEAISRIVNNLVENAIKFTGKEGEIVLSLSANKNRIIFSVKDTGRGIPMSLQKKVFRPYFQIIRQNSNPEGIGLGLPIVKKIVDRLSGTIRIESHPPGLKGTTITVTLPGYRAPGNNKKGTYAELSHKLNYELETVHISESEISPDKRSLLIIEDNRLLIRFLNQKLRDAYNIFCASNGAEAFKKLNGMSVVPDLIVSDIVMDKMDGFTFAKKLSEQERFAHIPLIFLTAKSGRMDRLKSLKLGAADFITKPFSFVELNLKIETVLVNLDKQRMALLRAAAVNLKSPNTAVGAVGESYRKSNLEENCRSLLFTPRETDVVRLVVTGKTYKAIAEDLFISEKTVTKHMQNIFAKAAVSSKIALINKLNKQPASG